MLVRIFIAEAIVARVIRRVDIDALYLFAVAFLQQVESLSNVLSQFGKFELETWTGAPADEDLELFVSALHGAVQKAVEDQDLLIPWSLYLTRRKEANELALSEFVELLERKRIKPDELSDAYAYCTYSTITREAFRNIPQLGRFTGLKHNQIRDEFKRLDKEIIALRGKAIAYECTRKASPPPGRNGARVDDRTEMVLLNYLMPQQRPRMPVRKILTRAGGSIQALKPCPTAGSDHQVERCCTGLRLRMASATASAMSLRSACLANSTAVKPLSFLSAGSAPSAINRRAASPVP